MIYSVKKNWAVSYDFMTKYPIVILPFIMTAFFECLALEFIFFSTRNPVSHIARPIIRKFFGEAFVHYPMCLVLLPKLFYYGQIVIYVVAGVLMAALSVNIFKNVRAGLPLIFSAILKNGLKKYLSFVIYGILASALLILLRRADIFVFKNIVRLTAEFLPNIPEQIYRVAMTLFMLLTHVIMQVFLILTVPIIVMENRSLLFAVVRSVYLGGRNFFTIFGIIVLPFMIYAPMALLMNFSEALVNAAVPEITFYLAIANIVVTIFIDCYILICGSQFLTDADSERVWR